MSYFKNKAGALPVLLLRIMLFGGVILFISQTAAGREVDTTEVRSISEILIDEDKNGELDLLGTEVTVGGIATVGSNVLHDSYLMVYVQDRSNGILVFSDSLQKSVNRGDSLVVTGKLQLYYGKPEIAVKKLGIFKTDSQLPAPVLLDDAFKNPERYVGMLVKGEAIISGRNFDSDRLVLEISPSDTSGYRLDIYVSRFHTQKNKFNFEMLSVGDVIVVSGIMDKFIFENSGEVDYEIIPRSPQDITYSGIPRQYLDILFWGGGFAVLLVLGWMIPLRRQVKSRTEELSGALKEKEVMMQEIHHRVKNNLSMITSLFDLQMSTTNTPEVHDILKDSQSRIQTMALIHDKLYQTGSYTDVRLDDYINELAEEIHGTFFHLKNSVSLEFGMEPVNVHVDKAVTCGLLVNELIVNAFKHAFPGMEQGEGVLEIALDKSNGDVVLTVADNGPGLPDDFGSGSLSSIGSDLISTFADQLEAEIEIDRDRDGAAFVFRFPTG